MYHVRLTFTSTSCTFDVYAQCMAEALRIASDLAFDDGHKAPIVEVSAQRLSVVYADVPF